MSDDDLLIKTEVAEILRVSVRTIERLFRMRRLPYFKVGRQHLVKRVDVYKYLRSVKVA